jgi:hypothetical protein
MIDITEFDVEIVRQRFVVGGAEIGGGARHVARVSLLDGKLRHRFALGLVAVEQPWAGHAFEHHCQLPSEVVGIMDTRVAAETAVGRHEVCGVADDEDAPALELARHVGGCAPARHAIDLDVEVGHAGASAHQLDQPLLAGVGSGIGGLNRINLRIADGVHHHEARLAILLQAKEPAEHRIVDVDDADRFAAELAPQVGAKIDRYAVRKNAATVEWEAEDLAHFAVCAIGADQIAAPEAAFRAAIDIAHPCGYAVGVLTESDNLATRADLRANLFGAFAQHSLQAGLVDEQPPARRQAVVDPDVEAGDDVRELAPGEIVHRNERALGHEVLLGLETHLILDAGSAKQFDCPQVEMRSSGQRRAGSHAFDRY